jgi:hypothetical protein
MPAVSDTDAAGIYFLEDSWNVRANREFSFLDAGSLSVFRWLSDVGNAGKFLIKDLVLLAASIWTAAEARKAF